MANILPGVRRMGRYQFNEAMAKLLPFLKTLNFSVIF